MHLAGLGVSEFFLHLNEEIDFFVAKLLCGLFVLFTELCHIDDIVVV